ncbi:hypothetical protein QTP86_029260 [Hemibagrus guttatus]|nr:hypothetical protein QTP86_029260 [Hemibagrus guttatus]
MSQYAQSLSVEVFYIGMTRFGLILNTVASYSCAHHMCLLHQLFSATILPTLLLPRLCISISFVTCFFCSVSLPALPDILACSCTEKGVMVVLHCGSKYVQWELYVGDCRLDLELLQLGGYRLNGGDDGGGIWHTVLYYVEYDRCDVWDLNLKNTIVKMDVTAVRMVARKVEHSLVQCCSFPVWEFLGCFPEGRIVIVTDMTHTIPPTKPNSTSLLDASCKPTARDSSRALFNFSLDSCGTTMTVNE